MEINLENFIWDDRNISEVFAMPIGLKPVADIQGEKLYGSEKLNQSFLKAMSKNGKMKPVISKLHQLVNSGKINPVFYEKGLFKFAAWKIFSPMNQRYTTAFYWFKENKIFINISNTANIFTMVPNNHIAELLLHEMMHMVAHDKNSTFLQLWMPDLIKYYTEVFHELLKVKIEDIPNNFVKNIILLLSKNLDVKPSPPSSFVLKYRKELRSLSGKSTLSHDQFEKRLEDFLYMGLLVVYRDKVWAKAWPKFKYIVEILEQAYHRAFNVRYINVICSQEIIVPSEVAAVCTTYSQFLKKAHATVNKL